MRDGSSCSEAVGMQLNDAAGEETGREKERERSRMQNCAGPDRPGCRPAHIQYLHQPVCVSLSGTADPLQSGTNSVDPHH